METEIFEIDPAAPDPAVLEACAKILREGGTLAMPTETVYGLGANGLDPAAVGKIYEAKGRPSDNPLILHVADQEGVAPLVKAISSLAQALMDAFWPGPLTLIFEKSELVPSAITGGLNTVAIRMPGHPVARELIRRAGVPVAAPSANLSGKPSPTRAQHVIQDLTGKVTGILAAGDCPVGVESTVLDLTVEPPTVLRPGGITLDRLREKLPQVVDAGEGKLGMEKEGPKAPGMKYVHYAPRAPLVLITGPLNTMVKQIKALVREQQAAGKKVGILCTDETKTEYGDQPVFSMGSRQALEEIAANLFHGLRFFDQTDVDVILAEAVSQEGLGLAIMNRLKKAAGERIILAEEEWE